MATVVGKTSLRIDELLSNVFVGSEIHPSGNLLFTTRGGEVINAGQIVAPDTDPAQDGWVNVKDYGALGDGVTDDTPAVELAMAEAPVGAVIWFPAGIYMLRDLTIPATIATLKGVRGDGNSGTRLMYIGTGTFVTSNHFINIEDLSLIGSGTPTGKTGIHIDGNPPTQINQQSRLLGVLVANFNVGLSVTDSVSTVLIDCAFADCVTHATAYYYAGAGDAGDHTITNCLFTGPAKAHTYIESSGGHKITGCKYIFGERAIDVQSVKFGLSVLTVTGNSIESQSIESIRIDQKPGYPSGTFAWAAITGNEIGTSAGGAIGLTSIRLGLGLWGFTVTGNLILGRPSTPNATGIICGAVRGTITGNLFAYVDVGIDFRSEITGTTQGSATVGSNEYLEVNTYVAERIEFDATPRPFVDHRYRVNLGPASSATVDIFSIACSTYASFVVKATYGGLVQGNGRGQVSIAREWAITRDSTGAYSVTNIQSHNVGFPACETIIDLALTNLAGILTLSVQEPALYGHNGFVTLEVMGSPVSVTNLTAA